MNDERFDIDVSYRDPMDPRDDFPADKPSLAEYEDEPSIKRWRLEEDAVQALLQSIQNLRGHRCNAQGSYLAHVESVYQQAVSLIAERRSSEGGDTRVVDS